METNAVYLKLLIIHNSAVYNHEKLEDSGKTQKGKITVHSAFMHKTIVKALEMNALTKM